MKRLSDFLAREKQLLVQAKHWMPRLPFESVDLLIIDEIGKNVSGSGMDTNVIGRKYNDYSATDNDGVRVRRIFVRGLTHETHGNACGLGMAEVTMPLNNNGDTVALIGPDGGGRSRVNYLGSQARSGR